MSTAMIAMTTSSSISVNAGRERLRIMASPPGTTRGIERSGPGGEGGIEGRVRYERPPRPGRGATPLLACQQGRLPGWEGKDDGAGGLLPGARRTAGRVK